MLNKDKYAQISSTLTWIIATIIIIVLLVVFIYASALLAKTKVINKLPDLKTHAEKEIDWIALKTSIAYLNKCDNKDKINEWIGKENE